MTQDRRRRDSTRRSPGSGPRRRAYDQARDPQRRALLRGELGVADNEILFGHVGRFSAQKNHPGLLKIFAAVRARLPKARLVLLGGGEPGYIEEIQNLAPAPQSEA